MDEESSESTVELYVEEVIGLKILMLFQTYVHLQIHSTCVRKTRLSKNLIKAHQQHLNAAQCKKLFIYKKVRLPVPKKWTVV